MIFRKKIWGVLLVTSICVNLVLASHDANATTYQVGSAAEINALPELLPGDVVIMKNGVWTNQTVIFKGEGTESNPIVLKAETPGQVVLTGSSTLSIAGDYLQVESLKFLYGTVAGNVIEFRRGSLLANHCRLTNTTIKDYSPTDKNTDSKWISLYGTYNRVDHCSLSGKTNLGTTLVVWMDETPDYHLIDHNYFGYRPELGQNGGETIRIGTSQWVEYASNTVFEYNLFNECDGEVEIISNKSVGNIYRYNTFKDCDGTLTLRHGSYCRVYGNFFFGDPSKSSGGVRIIGEGHEVYNNYFEGLNGTSYRAAISLVNGIPDSPVSGYYQVKKAKIGFNTIIDCKQPFAIGAGASDSRTLPPTETLIANNLIKARSGYTVIEDYDETNGITWHGNVADGEELGINTTEGFKLASISMEESDGLYRPTPESVVIGNASTVWPEITDDIDGQPRPANSRDVGCDQLAAGSILNYPLTKDEVGADYDSVTTGQVSRKITEEEVKVLSTPVGIRFVFPDSAQRKLSLWGINGAKISQFEITGNEFTINRFSTNKIIIVQVQEVATAYSLKVIL